MANAKKQGSDYLSFTEQELYRELEKARSESKNTRRKQFTPEQDKFILAALDNPNPVQYPKILELWEKAGWGRISDDSIRNRLRELKQTIPERV